MFDKKKIQHIPLSDRCNILCIYISPSDLPIIVDSSDGVISAKFCALFSWDFECFPMSPPNSRKVLAVAILAPVRASLSSITSLSVWTAVVASSVWSTLFSSCRILSMIFGDYVKVKGQCPGEGKTARSAASLRSLPCWTG